MADDQTHTRKAPQPRTTTGTPPLPTLRELRRMTKAEQLTVYREGGQWMRSQWSEARRANIVEPMHYDHNEQPERVVLAAALCV